ncbi:MAG: DUF1800 domain-containing protein [Chitinophagaceae bacterium]
MAVSLQIKNQHLLSRAGFGISATNISSIKTTKPKDLFQTLVRDSAQPVQAIDVAHQRLKDILAGVESATMMDVLKKTEPDNDTKKFIREQSREDLKTLNIKWLDEMVNSKAVLREKMSLFWHGHFACRDVNIIFQQNLLHAIRKNALGNFKDLLIAVSKSASMLGFLNNQQNRKRKPNENFAREVLELFTMGRGNYTEQDIKEAARAFTGWGFNKKGEFEFRQFIHDDGEKTFLGQTGKFTGDDILNIILQQKQTAVFIAQKIYKFFVNEVVDSKNVDWLAARFYKNNYDISALLKDIFTSDWFYAEKNISSKIKSPIELIVGIRKIFNLQIDQPQTQLIIQRALGQVLFYPPNVAGWPGGTNWIDSSTLMFRLQLPRLIKDDETINISTKSDDDVQMGMKEEKIKKVLKNFANRGFKINTTINWENFMLPFANVKREDLLPILKQTILPIAGEKIKNEVVEKEADKSSREAYIKTVAVALMSTPEYQLC